MKRFLWIPIFLFALTASAQSRPGALGQYTFGTIAATGQLGTALTFFSYAPPPANYTIDWSNAGTAPSACTFQVEGSSDGSHWYALTASTDCTAPSMFHIASKPVAFVRIDVLTYTAGSGSTAVIVNYTRGQ